MRFTHTGTGGLYQAENFLAKRPENFKKCTKKQKFFRALKSAVNIQKTFLKKRVKLITSIHEGIIADNIKNCNTFYEKTQKNLEKPEFSRENPLFFGRKGDYGQKSSVLCRYTP